jgi:hypothetical protein
VDAVRADLKKKWGKAAPAFVAAISRQLSEHRGYKWTKRIMGGTWYTSHGFRACPVE